MRRRVAASIRARSCGALGDGGHGAPPPPVGSAQFVDSVDVDAGVVRGEVVIGEQGDGVLVVLLVRLDDLELGQEEIGRREGLIEDCHALTEVERVAHLDAVEEHIGLALVDGIKEEEPVLSVEDVELLLGLISEPGEDAAGVAGLL